MQITFYTAELKKLQLETKKKKQKQDKAFTLKTSNLGMYASAVRAFTYSTDLV